MKRYLSMFVFFFLFHSTSIAVIRGSEIAVSVQSYYTFPAVDILTDNIMLGFGWFKNGFGLEDSSTTCTYNSVFPISGNVDLNGGMLWLRTDLIFQNPTTIVSPGIIASSYKTVNVCSSITSLEGPMTLVNTNLDINADINITGTIYFEGNCIVNGHGNALILDSDACLHAKANSTLTLRNIDVNYLNNGKLVCADDSVKLILDNVQWLFDQDLIFSKGSIDFIDRVEFIGAHKFVYESVMTSTIEINSKWSLDFMDLVIGRSMYNGYDPLYLVDQTSILGLNDTNLIISENGLQFVNGTLLVNGDVLVTSLSTDTSRGFMLGSGVPEEDMTLYINGGGTVRFSGGALVYDITKQENLVAATNSVQIIRNNGNIFYIKQDVNLQDIQIKADYTIETILEPGANFYYHETLFTDPGMEFILTGTRYNFYSNLLAGNGLLSISRGTMPLYTYVQGPGNSIVGTGSVNAKIIIVDQNSELNYGLKSSISDDIILNGGTLILIDDLKFTNAAQVIGAGLVDVSNCKLELPVQDIEITGTFGIQSSNGVIEINSEVDLSGTWTISGRCVINGNGNSLNLLPGGQLVLGQDAVVEIRHLVLSGMSDTNISCLSETSQLWLHDVVWQQDDMYTFSTGSLAIHDNVRFLGNGIFTYASTKTSTITHNAKLILDEGFSFRYDPANGLQDLWRFEDDTASIVLAGATVYIGSFGMALRNGALKVTKNSDVYAESDQGLILGDGVADHDTMLNISNGVGLSVRQGALRYNNVSNASLVLKNDSSHISFFDNTTFFLYSPITYQRGVINFYENTYLARIPDTLINGSINVFGQLYFLDI